MTPIRPAEIRSILELTDSLGIHREGVVIPLLREGEGGVRLAGTRLQITAPANRSVEEWLPRLREMVVAIDTSTVRKIEPDED